MYINLVRGKCNDWSVAWVNYNCVNCSFVVLQDQSLASHDLSWIEKVYFFHAMIYDIDGRNS